MKKLLTSFAIATIFSIAAQAQDASTTVPSTATATQQQATNPNMKNRRVWKEERANKAAIANPDMTAVSKDGMKKTGERKERKEEKYHQAFIEQKAKKERRHEIMKTLSVDQKIAVKQEIIRHRQVMQQFGFGDDALPSIPQDDAQQ